MMFRALKSEVNLRFIFKSFFLFSMMLLLGMGVSTAQTSAATKKKSSGKSHASAKHRKGAKKTSWKRKGQQGIQPERARSYFQWVTVGDRQQQAA
jgi:hypothetical protein